MAKTNKSGNGKVGFLTAQTFHVVASTVALLDGEECQVSQIPYKGYAKVEAFRDACNAKLRKPKRAKSVGSDQVLIDWLRAQFELIVVPTYAYKLKSPNGGEKTVVCSTPLVNERDPFGEAVKNEVREITYPVYRDQIGGDWFYYLDPGMVGISQIMNLWLRQLVQQCESSAENGLYIVVSTENKALTLAQISNTGIDNSRVTGILIARLLHFVEGETPRGEPKPVYQTPCYQLVFEAVHPQLVTSYIWPNVTV